MHTPLDSVAALARFSFNEAELARAQRLLKEVTDWHMWLDQIEQHGLSGFANKHIAERDLAVPPEIKMALKALNIRHAAAANARYQTLCEVGDAFEQSDIPYLALKGAALMPYLYKEDRLRPMRDMDLLLPRDLLHQGAARLREIGFDLPEEQPSKFMRDMHQLPNATKTVNGFITSIELHHDGISREVAGHFYYPHNAKDLQVICWRDLEFNALEDIKMIHQVSKHLEGLHPGAMLKLINVMDVIGLAMLIDEQGKWAHLQSQYPHVLNTLRCLHLLTPLPDNLQRRLTPLPDKVPSGVGQIMGSMRNAMLGNKSLKERLHLLLSPSDWWLYLYYNVDPDKSLWWIKWVRHPLRVSNWLLRRAYSRLQGG